MRKFLRDIPENRKKFLYFMVMACAASVVIYYEASMNMQNLATYLFSYRYGFIPRGFIGTIIDGFLSLFGLKLTYFKCLCISGVATAGYYALLLFCYALFLKKIPEGTQPALKVLLIFFSWFSYTEFITWNNFGRTDEYLTILVLLAVILLVTETMEWLVVPLCAIAVMVHSGFTFTNSGLILALLLYKAIAAYQKQMKEGKKQGRYYLLLCILSFAVISVLFLYMQVFRGPVSMEIYNTIREEAIRIATEGNQGGYLIQLESLIDSELLRKDVYDFESQWRAVNIREFPIFVVLFVPYILILVRFMVGVMKKAVDRLDRFKYLILFIGVGTILPDLLLKVDYGRWIFCIILYYCLTVMTVAALGDGVICETMTESFERLKKHKICWLLLVYPVLFVPFRDVSISDLTLKLMNLIFGFYV